MSAPAGWHQQPDGRERFWDGRQWTGQYRSAAGSDHNAPPPPPSWAGGAGRATPSEGDVSVSSQDTRAMDVDRTQPLPATPAATDPGAVAPAAAYGGSAPYGAPGQPPQPAPDYPPGAYAPGGYPPTGPGSPGDTGWQPTRRSGSSGLVKGCLIAAVVLLLLLVGVVVAVIFLFDRAADEVRSTIPSGFPTSLPSDLPSILPTDFPSNLPTALPTEGLGQTVEISVGKGFAVPRAGIEDGWSLDAQGVGALSAVRVKGMKATLGDGGGLPVLFTMSFPTADGGRADTVCTSQSGATGDLVDVQCIPMLGDVGDATRGTVTTTL